MNKHDVIIKQVNIHDQKEKLNQKCHKKPYKAAIVCGLVIIVDFE